MRQIVMPDADVRIENGLSLDAVIWVGTRFDESDVRESNALEYPACSPFAEVYNELFDELEGR